LSTGESHSDRLYPCLKTHFFYDQQRLNLRRLLGLPGEFPQSPALEVANRVASYSDLREMAFQLAATFWKYELSDQAPLAAVFGYRSVTAFAGILAALLRGLR
jgi:hypothetical protein